MFATVGLYRYSKYKHRQHTLGGCSCPPGPVRYISGLPVSLKSSPVLHLPPPHCVGRGPDRKTVNWGHASHCIHPSTAAAQKGVCSRPYCTGYQVGSPHLSLASVQRVAASFAARWMTSTRFPKSSRPAPGPRPSLAANVPNAGRFYTTSLAQVASCQYIETSTSVGTQ